MLTQLFLGIGEVKDAPGGLGCVPGRLRGRLRGRPNSSCLLAPVSHCCAALDGITDWASSRFQQHLHKLLAIEGDQVVQLLAHSGEQDR